MTSYPVSYPVTRPNAYGVSPAVLGTVSAPSWVIRAGGALPKLDADIANDLYWVRGVGIVTSDQLFSVSRASTKYVQSASGLLIPISSGAFARSDLGGSFEEGRTNLLRQSNAFSTSPWTLDSGVTVTTGAAGGPLGAATMCKLVESANNSTQRTVLNNEFTASAASYTISIYAAAAGRNFIFLQAIGSGAPATNNIAWFNLGAGALGTVQANVTASIVPSGIAGVYRCSITFTGSAALTGVRVGLANADISQSYQGDGSSGAYISAIQEELGARASSYIPTTSSSASRSADSVTGIGGLALLSTSGAVRIRYAAGEANSSTTRTDVFAVGADAANNNRFAMRAANGDGLQQSIQLGNGTGVNGANILVAVPVGIFAVMAANWTPSSGNIAINGSATAPVTGSAPLGWNYQAVAPTIGASTVGNYLNGNISRLTVWDSGVNDSLIPGLAA